jgi:hypothetical protein
MPFTGKSSEVIAPTVQFRKATWSETFGFNGDKFRSTENNAAGGLELAIADLNVFGV